MVKGLVCILLVALFVGCYGTDPCVHWCNGQDHLILSDRTGEQLVHAQPGAFPVATTSCMSRDQGFQIRAMTALHTHCNICLENAIIDQSHTHHALHISRPTSEMHGVKEETAPVLQGQLLF